LWLVGLFKTKAKFIYESPFYLTGQKKLYQIKINITETFSKYLFEQYTSNSYKKKRTISFSQYPKEVIFRNMVSIQTQIA